MMLAQGLEGAAVELHPHHIVIRRAGIINSMHGIGGEKSIPLSSITSVQFKDAGFFVSGFIRLSLIGETKPDRNYRDPHKIVFNQKHAAAFRLLRDAVQNAINIPSLASLATQHMQNGVGHAPARYIDGEHEVSQPRRLENARLGRPDTQPVLVTSSSEESTSSDPTWASAFDEVPPWHPRSLAQWWRDQNLNTRILIAGAFSTVLLSRFVPADFDRVSLHTSESVTVEFRLSMIVFLAALALMAGSLLVRVVAAGLYPALHRRARQALPFGTWTAAFAFLFAIFTGAPSSPASEPTVEYVGENGQAVPENEADSSRAMPAPTSTKPSGWIGNYNGTLDGATGTLKIKEQPDHRLSISLAIGGARCAGGIDAVVDQPKGDDLTIAKAPYEDGDDQESACRLNIHRSGREIVLDEEEACMSHHGISCGFDGTASRSK